MKTFWFILAVFSISVSGMAGTFQVKSHQKISDIEGSFSGMLDDGDHFGNNGSCLSDFDGDGTSDMAIGAYLDDDGGTNRGAVWILFLNPDGTVKSHQKISNTEGGFTGILDDGDEFGASVTNLGDLDKDGVLDLAVGAYYDDDGGENTGAIWILFMNANGTVKGHQKINRTSGGFGGLLGSWDKFGGALSNLGDLDGDGNTDLAVGASGDDTDGTYTGAVWILFLNQNGTVKSYQKINHTEGNFTGEIDAWDEFGYSVSSLGDLDGDSIADLAVGAPFDDDGGTDRGAVWILFLNNNGTVKTYQKISSTEGSFSDALHDTDSFGARVGIIGDLNNDNSSDLLVGATGDTELDIRIGAALILFLNSNGTVKGYQKISQTQGNFTGALDYGDTFGIATIGLGDLNKDGTLDIAVGAHCDDDGGTDRGAVWVLFMEGTELPPSVFHVDGITGNDNNTGLTRQTAFATIQRGIDKAKDGYTVLVWPAVYNQSLYFLNKAITVRSADEPATITATGTYAVSIYTSESQSSVLSNFIIKNSESGIFVSSGSPTLNNLTIVNNGIGIESWSGANPNITNCIFWNNSIQDLFQCTASFSYFDQTTDPLFADFAGGDYHLKSQRGRYWPAHNVWVLDSVSSPCIDGGDPNIFPANEPMPNGGRINMGAYGNTPYASMSDWPLKCDLNYDGICDMTDFAIFADDWLEQFQWMY